jgi:hypothetical protein
MLLPLDVLGFCFVTVWLGPRSHRGGHRGGHWVAVFTIFAVYVFSKGGVLGFTIFDVLALRVVLRAGDAQDPRRGFLPDSPPNKK